MDNNPNPNTTAIALAPMAPSIEAICLPTHCCTHANFICPGHGRLSELPRRKA
jgi:hypothetical protein